MTGRPGPGAQSLLGLAVRYRGLKLGAVVDVLVDAGGGVLGVEVDSGFADTRHFLPWPAASLSADGVEAGPLALLSAEDVGFYLRRGARRVTAPDSEPAPVHVSSPAAIG